MGPHAAGSLAGAFRASCRRHARQPALIYRDTILTYEQLGEEVARAAAGIAARLTGPGAGQGPLSVPVVAVILDPSPALISAVLATVDAGAAYLPLDPSAPDEYLNQVLSSARPLLVITTPAHRRRFRGAPCPVVALDALTAGAGRAAAGPGRRPATGSAPGPACVIYTSGSTGTPKGVVLSHAAMLNSTAARTAAYGKPERMPLLHSIAFDLASGVVFWGLLSGGCLVVNPAKLNDVAATLALIREHEISHLVYAASLYAPFLDRAAAAPPGSLRHVMIGSERWSPALIGRHAEVLPGASLYNEYGPTEACVWSSYARVYDKDTREQRPLTLGRPILNAGYQVRDGSGAPAAAGGRGELYITGAGLADGYLGDPGLTARSFVALEDGTRAFRSGDLVELNDSGECVFAGRLDRQVKVQGNRIEAGHVETVLMSHPGVQHCHVMARNDSGMGSALAAYVVPRGGATTFADGAAAVLDAHMRSRVPGYMVPSAFVVMPELPRTLNGKTDESALPAPGGPAAPAQARAADPVERRVAEMAAEVLGVPGVDTAAPLRGYGANSLALVRIAALIAKDFGADVPISALFRRQTVRDIAAAVREARPAGRPPLTRHPQVGDPAPLSPQQQQVWVMHHASPRALAYNTQFSVRLTGTLNLTALEQALSYIVARHEILRTTFHDSPLGPVQVVRPAWRATVETADLRDLSEPARASAMQAGMRRTMTVPFDIGALPLVRWSLYRLAEDSWSLFQVEHHFVHDGWSASLFLREIRDAYDAFSRGGAPDSPALAVQYRDYALWHREWAATGDYRAQAEYWLAKLQGCPPAGVTFETVLRRPAVQGFKGGCLRGLVPPELVSRIDALCAEHGVTRFAAFLSAFAMLVWRHTAETDFVVGSALSNRRHAESAPMLGMFVNALPLRLAVDPAASIGDLAQATMRSVLGAQDHQEFPFIDMVKRLGLPRDASRNPLFQLMFAFHDSPRPKFELEGLRGELRIDHNGSAKNDLNVVCVPNPPQPGSGLDHAGVDLLWEYDSGVFTADAAQMLMTEYLHVLESLAGPWDTPLAEADLMSRGHRERLAEAGTGAAAQTPFPTLHEGVEAAIRRAPGATAVIHDGTCLSYRMIGELAGRIEARLAAHGAGPGSAVLVACELSPALVAACLAVLRRGAAYVCVDGDLPDARLRLMVSDIEPAAVICCGPGGPWRDLGLPVVALAPGGEPAPVPGESVGEVCARRPAVAGGDRAYLVYTSGSTGTPKAVVASHANAVTALHARTVYFGAATPRTLVTLPPYFDVAGSMIFWTLWHGGTLILPPAGAQRDPDMVRGLVDAQSVTHVNFVASFYQQFLATLAGPWLSSLEVVAIGGEPCTPGIVDRHARYVPGAALHNEYGPTEATVWCSAAPVYTPQAGVRGRRVSVGRPLANYSMRVLDGQCRPVPVGASGELYVGGPGVALGYHNRPELTRERFVALLSGPLAGQRLYRTGDRARVSHDGEFEVLGRLDDQVKVRGYRIELGEVRQCLSDHPAVTDAHVRVSGSTQHPSVAAYLVLGPGSPREAVDDLRRWASARLPSYMVPATFTVIDEIPLTAAGKVDHALLPDPAPPGTAADAAAEAPTPRELVLRGLFSDVLGRADAGLDEDFFAMGGDSLQAIRLISLARQRGLRLSLTDLMQARTIRALAPAITEDAGAPGAPRSPSGRELPLTAIQQWFFEQRFADPDHFNQARLLTVADSVATDAIGAAVNQAMERHDAFRTRFLSRNGRWLAVLDGESPLRGPESRTLRAVPGSTATDTLGAAMDELHQSLSITGNRLYRAVLLEGPGTGLRLALVLHHLIVDAVSWDILLQDIEAACGRLAAGDTRLPPGAPSATADAPAPAPDGSERHWLALAAAPKPRLRTAGPREAAFGELTRGERALSARATDYLLYDVPRFSPATAQSLLLAALHEALRPATDGDGLYCFIEGHGRTGTAAPAEAVGWHTALYPVLLYPPATAGLTETAAAFRLGLDQAGQHAADYGTARYLRPQEPLGTALRASQSPQITFSYLSGRGHEGTALHADPGTATGAPIGAANVLPTPFDVTVAPGPGTLAVRFAFDRAHFGTGVAEAAIDRFTEAVEQAAHVPALAAARDPAAPAQFFVHPVSGTVQQYARLAEQLSAQWACYGLAQPDGDAAIGELAARHAERIRTLQPDGPYYLTGWSFGAAVAYEIARLLERQGDRVGRLTLLDPPRLDDASMEGPTAAHLAAVLPGAPGALLAKVAAAAAAGPAHLLPELPELAEAGPGLGHGFVARRIRVLAGNSRALRDWTPGPPPTAPALVLLPADSARPARVTAAAWWDNGRSCATAVVPGDHLSMLGDPGVREVAARYGREPWTESL